MPSNFHIGYPGSLEEYMRISRTIPAQCTVHWQMIQLHSQNSDLSSLKHFLKMPSRQQKISRFLFIAENTVLSTRLPRKIPYDGSMTSIAFFINTGIGRAVWSYKEMDFGLTGSLTILSERSCGKHFRQLTFFQLFLSSCPWQALL